jgi:hypothetical protein
MVRLLATTILLTSLCALASADQLFLQDGRVFTGKVTVREDTVVIDMPYGTMSFARTEVQRIDLKETPAEQLDRRLAKLGPKDTDGLCTLAEWAAKNSLDEKAKDLYGRAIQIDPDHAAARKALGFARIDGRWLEFDKSLELCRGKLEAGQFNALLSDALPAVREIAPKEKLAAVRELLAEAQRRAGAFADAAQTCRELAKSGAAAAPRFEAVAQILAENPDGMYVLTTAYPPESALLDKAQKSLPAGPASLSDPLALEAALRDRAKANIKSARDLMDAATKLEATDPDAAATKYAQAAKMLDQADAIVDGIARSYRIEIARRRIVALRNDADTDAKKYDALEATLGKKELAPQAYRALVLRMMHHLDAVRDGLNNVLELTRPFPRELVLETTWAQKDLRLIQKKRDILAATLEQ